MPDHIFLYTGSVIIFAWGVGHIIPTKSIISLFGPLTDENRRILTMEWVGEGLALCFIGALVALVTALGGSNNPVSRLVYWAAAGMALILGGWTFAIGFKTSIMPIKICPLVLSLAASLFVLGSLL